MLEIDDKCSHGFKANHTISQLNGVQYAARPNSPVVSVLECSSVVSIDRNLI